MLVYIQINFRPLWLKDYKCIICLGKAVGLINSSLKCILCIVNKCKYEWMEMITNLPFNQYKSHHLEIDDELMETNNPCLWITGILMHVLYNEKKNWWHDLKFYTQYSTIVMVQEVVYRKYANLTMMSVNKIELTCRNYLKTVFGILCKKKLIIISFRNF